MKQWRKRRVECIVQEAAAQCKPGDPYPLIKLRRRLEEVDPDLDPDFQDRPLGAAVRENPSIAPALADVVRAAVARYETPKGVLMPAAVWIVQARNS